MKTEKNEIDSLFESASNLLITDVSVILMSIL